MAPWEAKVEEQKLQRQSESEEPNDDGGGGRG